MKNTTLSKYRLWVENLDPEQFDGSQSISLENEKLVYEHFIQYLKSLKLSTQATEEMELQYRQINAQLSCENESLTSYYRKSLVLLYCLEEQILVADLLFHYQNIVDQLAELINH